jgi:hypothetical protein
LSLLEPDALWQTVQRRLQRPGALGWLLMIPVVGGFGVALAAGIGVRVFDSEWSAVFGYTARPDVDGARFRMLWAALALAPLVQGAVGASLLGFYSQPRRWQAALAVAVVGAVPVYVSGLAMVLLPGIVIVLVGFCVSVVWWATGAREVLGVSAPECAEFVVATLTVTGAALMLFSTLFALF